MKLFRLLSGVRKHPIGLLLVAGAVGVLVAVQRLIETQTVHAESGSPSHSNPHRHGSDYFRIRRTKSEIGYVYWVLQGYGQFRCYELYDTWREASDEAVRRVEMKQPWADYEFAAAS